MRVFIYGQKFEQDHLDVTADLLHALRDEESSISIYKPYLNLIHKHLSVPAEISMVSTYEELKSFQPDFVITLGGDGTILSAVTLIRELGIPIMGINLGRLGFLASIEKKRAAEAIRAVKHGKYKVDSRSMLYLESNLPIFGEKRFALNDFTLHKRDTSAMITIHTYINGEFLNAYWADGIIVGTPTGSTGYSLSCGGPIIFPNSGNFVITPVAPHNLNVRPLVISDSSVISFQIEGRSSNFLCTLDSRFETVTTEHRISVRRCAFETRLVQLHDFSFLRTINEKLTWGIDSRN